VSVRVFRSMTLAAGCLAASTSMVGAQQVTLRFEDGWPVIAADGRPVSRTHTGPAAWVTLPDDPLPGAVAPTPIGPTSVQYAFPQGTLVDTIEPFAAMPGCFVRRLAFENAAGKPRDLLGADLRAAFAAPEGAPLWQAQSFAMMECAPGGPTLCVAYTSPEDQYHCALDAGARVAVHHVEAAWRLAPGERAAIGAQYLWVVRGDLAAARRTTADWYDAVGLVVADGGPDWLRDCIVYQACAGGSVDSAFSDTGGFAPFSTQLDLIADMGCNAFWLMSVVTHKDISDPRRFWNLYGPLRFDQIDPAYGGEPGLSALVAAMRERGFRILTEIVPSGGYAPIAIEHPDWWTYARDGQRSIGFGQGMDYSSPGWQSTIRDTMRWLTQKWGFDGCRVDVADGYGVNWKSPTNGSHVSLSTHAGAIGMLRAIGEGMAEGGGRDLAIVPETGFDEPEYAPWGQVGYGFELIRQLGQVQTSLGDAARARKLLTDYFLREQGSLPPGMITLRTMNNHDTVVDQGRADRRFGVAAQRALVAVCTVVEGVPMIYQEQEVGSYSYLRKLFWARRRVPEMRRGTADYAAAEGPAEVFTVLRSVNGTHAIGLVNLSWETVRGEFRVMDLGDARLYDAVSGNEAQMADGRFAWTLAPYDAAVLRVGSPPEGEVPGERHAPQSVSDVAPNAALVWRGDAGTVEVTAGGVRCRVLATGLNTTVAEAGGQVVIEATGPTPGEGGLELQFTGVDRWLAETVTGVYEDRLLRRHYPWPEGLYKWETTNCWGYEPHNLYSHQLPAGRQWQSAVSDLVDDGSVILAGWEGRGIRVRCIDSNAENIVLTDRSEETDPEPYGLTLRFLAHDDALSRDWVPAYAFAGWTEFPSVRSAAAMGPPRLRIELSELADFAQALADAPPPSRPAAAQRRIGPGRSNESFGRLWLIEPNTVEWEGLRLSRAGDCTLWLELRHSEIGPDRTELTPHYHIELGGKPVTFEWARLDAWHTGNGYFGWARADVGPLQLGEHTMRIETTHTWCGIGPRTYISHDPAFRP